MKDVDKIIEYLEQEKKNKIKMFLHKILSKWYWFVIMGLIGLALGYLLSKYTQPVYKIKSTLLIYPEPQDMRGIKLFQGLDINAKANIQNQIEILNSYTLNRQVLENLDWRTSWYKKELISNAGLYQKEPFEILEYGEERNLTEIPVNIEPLSEKEFIIRVNKRVKINEKEMKVEFQKKWRFDEPFKNRYFHFTLKKKKGRLLKKHEKYYFRFNNVNNMTLNYLKKLKIKLSEKNADMIHLQLNENQPVRGVDYLNELNKVYVQFILNEKNKISENTVQFIDAQIRGVADSLQITGRSFTNFRSKNRIMDVGKEAGLVSQKLEKLKSDKSMAEMRLEYYNNLHNYLDDVKQMKQVVSPSVIGITDQALNALVLKLSDLYGNREILSYSVKEKNPSLLMINKEITHVRKSLDENLKNMMINTEIEINSLNKQIEKVKTQLSNLPKTEQRLISIKQRFDLNNELYTFLLKKRAEAAITKASNIPNSQILDPARVGTAVKLWPKTIFSLIIGLTLGLGLTFVVILANNYFNDTFQNAEEIERMTKIPLIGNIHHNHFKTEIPVKKYSRSGISESFRSLRTNLKYITPKKIPKVIALHSTIPGEGKSFTAINLAVIMAMNNKKVLLVEVDMRKPQLSKILNCSNNQPGISSYLAKQSKLEEIIKPTEIDNLSCVMTGIIPLNPAELLENQEFQLFLSKTREKFDFIILDNAPASIVTDGILAGQYADINLFVLRRNYSHKKQIKFINQIAEQKIIPCVAIVFNDISKKSCQNKYGIGKNYYKGYYQEKKTSNLVELLRKKKKQQGKKYAET